MNNSLDQEGAEAGELALKAHVLWSNPDIRADMTNEAATRREISGAVDLTEAPEDAVCTLVLDLWRYCEREGIDWTKDVISRAQAHVRGLASAPSIPTTEPDLNFKEAKGRGTPSSSR